MFGSAEVIKKCKRRATARAKTKITLYLVNKENFMEQFDKDDRDRILLRHDMLTDRDALSKRFESEIHSSFDTVRTLLDAAGVNHVPKCKRNETRSKAI